MKLLKFSRSRTNSPSSSPPSSPIGAILSPSRSEKRSGHLFFPLPPRLSRSRKYDVSSEMHVTTSSSKYDSGANASASRRTSSADHDDRPSSSPSQQGKTKQLLRRVPPSVTQELEQVFAQFDANCDGKISADELCAVLRSLGDETATREEAVLMVGEVDADGDGFIDLQEFVDLNTRCLHVTGEMSSHGELMSAFDIFDLDKNGHITAQELHKVLTNLGDQHSTFEDCKRMIRCVDRKGVGHVDFDDFKLMMTRA